MQKVEENKWLGYNATGGRKDMGTIELTKQPLCINQDDTMRCYDRIIRIPAIINSRKSRIPDNVCKLHLKSYDNIQFKNQIKNKTSKIIYKSTDKLSMHGQGKGIGNGGTK